MNTSKMHSHLLCLYHLIPVAGICHSVIWTEVSSICCDIIFAFVRWMEKLNLFTNYCGFESTAKTCFQTALICELVFLVATKKENLNWHKDNNNSNNEQRRRKMAKVEYYSIKLLCECVINLKGIL